MKGAAFRTATFRRHYAVGYSLRDGPTELAYWLTLRAALAVLGPLLPDPLPERGAEVAIEVPSGHRVLSAAYQSDHRM